MVLLDLAVVVLFFFFFNDTATTEIYTLSLHDALPISPASQGGECCRPGSASQSWRVPARCRSCARSGRPRSEEHTSELQSQSNLVCRLLPEKKNCSCSPSPRARISDSVISSAL